MSDKNEYWKELFGEDFPEINDSELDSKLMKETIESELYTDDSEVFSLVSDTVSDNSSDYTWINIDNDQEDESEKTNVVSENDLKDLYEHANAYFSADDEKTSVVKLPKESDSTNAASHGNDKNDKTDDGVDEYFPPSFPKLFKRKSDKSEQQSDADKTASVKSTAAPKSSAKYKTSKKTEGKKAIRRQRMSGCMIGLIYSAAVVCISVVLACLGWVAVI